MMEYDFSTMPCYCVKARWAAAAISSYYSRLIKPCGITGRQFTFLYAISQHDCCSARELADLIRVDKSTLTRNLKPLLARGIVVDLKAPRKRASRLSLSAEGRQILAAAFVQWQAAQASLAERFGSEELAVIDKVLEEIGALSCCGVEADA